MTIESKMKQLIQGKINERAYSTAVARMRIEEAEPIAKTTGEFNIGDRVVLRSGASTITRPRGIGTVVHDNGEAHSQRYGVEFDQYFSGHDCDGHAKTGHGWYVSNSVIELADERMRTENTEPTVQPHSIPFTARFRSTEESTAEQPYKVGDRVVCHHVGQNNTDFCPGTIISDSGVESGTRYGVHFDNYINGHDLNGQCEDGYGWFVGERNMEHLALHDRTRSVPVESTEVENTFRIGERVVCQNVGIANHSNLIGTVKAYRADEDEYAVQFDVGIDGHGCNGHVTNGQGWYVRPHHMINVGQVVDDEVDE